MLLEISDEESAATLDDLVSFALQSPLQRRNPTGILRVHLATGLERAPIGSDTLDARNLGLICRVGGNPGKNSGCDRASDVEL